ncbi:hypothetical protein CLV24_1261, partial [Pontibacter ummariensis]
MKRSFNHLTAKLVNAKQYLIGAATLLMLLGAALYLRAAVSSITPVSITAPADQAADQPGATFFDVGDIVMQEVEGGGFGSGTYTLVLKTSGNWKFNPNSATAVTLNSSSGGDVPSGLKPVISTDGETITFTLENVRAGNSLETVTITGVQVQPVLGNVALPAAGTVYIEGNSNIVGFGSNTTVANLTMTNGAVTSLHFSTAPTSALTNGVFNPQPEVTLQDKFGNTVKTGPTATASVSLSIGTNPPGNGVLKGVTTVSAVNGIAAFAGLSIDRAGQGYTLVATSPGITSATSSLFNIINREPGITSLSQTCSSVGDDAFSLTINGSEFASGAIVRVTNSAGVQTEIAPSSITETALQVPVASSVFTASGSYTIHVINRAADQADVVSNGVDFTVYPVLKQGDIAGETNPCGGTTATYTAPAGFASYDWSVPTGVGTIVAGQGTRSVDVTYSAAFAGASTLSLSATNECSKASSTTLSLTVKGKPVITLSSNTSICLGASTALSANGADSYMWSPSTGLTSTSGATVTANPTSTTTYTVTGTTNGCQSEPKTVTVTVNQQPAVAASAPTSAKCVGANSTTTFELVGEATNGSPTWSFVSGTGTATVSGFSSPNTGNTQVTVIGTGTVTVMLTSSSGVAGCTSATKELTLTVNPLPAATVTAGAATTFCQGGSVVLSAPEGSYSYQWFNGTTAIASTDGGTARQYTASTSGSYTVRVTNTQTSCTATTAMATPVTVLPQPTAAIAEGVRELCIGADNRTTFTVTGDYSGGTPRWLASSNFAVQSSSYSNGIATATVVATGTGSGTVTLETFNTAAACSTASNSVTLKVNPLPVATITANGVTSFCAGGTVRLTAGGGTSWLWSNGAETQSIDVNASGTFTVQVTDANKCTSLPSDPVQVTVTPAITGNSLTSGDQLICSGTAASQISGPAAGGGTGSFTYEWESRTSETAAYTKVANSTNSTSYSPGVLTATGSTATIWYRRKAISGNCVSYTDPVKVTVTPVITNSISGTQEYCHNAPASALGGAVSGGNGSYTYKWQSSPNGTDTWTTIPNAGNASFAPPTSTVGTVYYRRLVTSGGCADKPSNALPVTVNSVISGNSIAGTQTVCSGVTLAPLGQTLNTAVSGGATPYSYQWQVSTDNSNWDNIPTNGNAASYTPPVQTVTSPTIKYYRRVVNGGGCSNTSGTVSVTINPLPDASFSGVMNGQILYTEAIYAGHTEPGKVTLTPTGTTGGTFSIVNPANTSGLSGNVLNLCAALGTATEKTITIKYAVTSPNNCTATEEKTITIKKSVYIAVIEADPFPLCQGQLTYYTARVYRDPVIVFPYKEDPTTITGDNPTVTYNPAYNPYLPAWATDVHKQAPHKYFQPRVISGAEINTSANPELVFSYQWKSDGTSVSNNSKTISNARQSNVNYISAEITWVQSICGSPTTLKINSLSNPFYLADLGGVQISVTASPTVICAGGSTVFKAVGAGLNWLQGDAAFTWMLTRGNNTYTIKTVQGTNSNLELTSNEIKAALATQGVTPSDLQDRDQVYVNLKELVKGQSKCLGSDLSNSVEIRVTPLPTLMTVTGGGEYCAVTGATGVPVGLSGSQTGVSYQLVRTVSETATNVGNPITGTGSAISFGNQTIAGAYTVQATTISNSTSNPPVAACPRTMTGSAVVKTNPLPAVSVNSPATCAGVPVEVKATVSNGTAPFSYNWTVPDGVSKPANTVFAFQTLVAGTYSVVVTDSKGCSSASGSGTVTVNPLPTVEVNSPAVCAGSIAKVTAEAKGGAGSYSYTWTVPDGWSGSLPTSASFDTTVPGTYTVKVTDSKNCSSSAAATSTVTINQILNTTGIIQAKNENGAITASNPIKIGGTVTFTAALDISQAAASNANYTWYTRSNGALEWTQYPTDLRTEFITISPVPAEPFDVRVDVKPNNDGVNCYSNLTMTTVKITPLPVELIYLNASRQGNNVVLDWATASEEGNAGFEVQVSEDGFNFRKLAFVETRNGNSSLKQV